MYTLYSTTHLRQHSCPQSLIPSLILLTWRGTSSLDDTESLHPPENVESCTKIWHRIGTGSEPTPFWLGINHCRLHNLSASLVTVWHLSPGLAACVWIVRYANISLKEKFAILEILVFAVLSWMRRFLPILRLFIKSVSYQKLAVWYLSKKTGNGRKQPAWIRLRPNPP